MKAFAPEEVGRVHAMMKRIEDVRPMMSAFHWSFHEIRRLGKLMDPEQAQALQSAFSDALRTIATDF